uniref:Salivary C-type lectin n=1 Tax=Sergentomyia schwetzi TaxID=114605 RepID=A0A6B9VN48_9DIPT|nr:salivary C-type lectin [Sergentomyia schwetzi]
MNKIILLGFLVIFLQTGKFASAKICGETFVRIAEGKAYYIFMEEKSWMEAYSTCKSYNLTLASPKRHKDNDELYKVLRDLNLRDKNFWIGGYRSFKELGVTIWRWTVDNEEIKEFDWADEEPNYYTKDEQVIELRSYSAFPEVPPRKWNDQHVDTKLFYICEYTKNPAIDLDFPLWLLND